MRCPRCNEELDYIEVNYIAVYYIVDYVFKDGTVQDEVDKKFLETFEEKFRCPFCGEILHLDPNKSIVEQLRDD